VSQKRSQEIESIHASLVRGGRFNPPLAFGALHLGESEKSCLDEVKSHAGGDLDILRPLVIGVFHLHLSKVLDLTDSKVLAVLVNALKIKLTDLMRPGHHALSQRIGRVARELGYEGVLFHSAARPGNKNLAVFVDLLEKKSSVKKASVRRVTI